MALFGPFFEINPVAILTAGAAVVAPGINTSILKIGEPEKNSSPFAGVLVQFAISPSGGAADSGCTILVYRSFDGVVIDDQEILTIAIAAADIGSSGTWYQTEMFPAVPADSGEQPLGYAVRFNIANDGVGSRTLAATVTVRRWRYKFGM